MPIPKDEPITIRSAVRTADLTVGRIENLQSSRGSCNDVGVIGSDVGDGRPRERGRRPSLARIHHRNATPMLPGQYCSPESSAFVTCWGSAHVSSYSSISSSSRQTSGAKFKIRAVSGTPGFRAKLASTCDEKTLAQGRLRPWSAVSLCAGPEIVPSQHVAIER